MSSKFVKESAFQLEVKTYLDKHDCELFHSSTVGMPDLGVIAPGIIFFLEIKRHSKNKYKATDAQLDKMRKIKERGHQALILSSDMNWQQKIDNILKSPKTSQTPRTSSQPPKDDSELYY